MSSSQLSQCDTHALQRFSVFVCASSLRSLPQTVASAPKPNCRAVPCNGNGPCPSRLIAGQRCVRRSARVAAGPWYNDATRLTSNSEIEWRVGGTESPLAQSDTEFTAKQNRSQITTCLYTRNERNNVQGSLPLICKLVAAYQGLHRSFHNGTPRRPWSPITL